VKTVEQGLYQKQNLTCQLKNVRKNWQIKFGLEKKIEYNNNNSKKN
jgi:hypothetical protein